MPLLARRAASATERTLVYFRMNMYIRPPLRLSSSPTHQSISGRCWTRAYFRDGSKADLTAHKSYFPLYPRKRTQVGHRGMSALCQLRKCSTLTQATTCRSCIAGGSAIRYGLLINGRDLSCGSNEQMALEAARTLDSDATKGLL